MCMVPLNYGFTVADSRCASLTCVKLDLRSGSKLDVNEGSRQEFMRIPLQISLHGIGQSDALRGIE